MSITIAILGGDSRCAYLANALARKGCDIRLCALESDLPHPPYIIKEKDWRDAVRQAGLLALPVPVCAEGGLLNAPLSAEKIPIAELLAAAPEKALITGGVVTPALRETAAALGREIIDVMLRDDLAIANAVPTAEGAIEIAMRETDGTVFGTRCLVTGCGRVSRALVSRLKGLGARVTIAARRDSDLAWAASEGFETCRISQLAGEAPRYELFFNTVPAPVLDEEVLDGVESGSLIIDLASRPGGVDFAFARRAGINAIHALSLPGKVAPRYAGECIALTLQNILAERGLTL